MISKKTKYAIKALIHLAKRGDRNPVVVASISSEEKIPHKFLEAILLELKRAGLVQSRKGKMGGYFLKASPDEISLAQLMRLFDGPIAHLPCVSQKFYEKCDECRDEETCGIRDTFLHLHSITIDFLEKSSLGKIVGQEQILEKGKTGLQVK